MEYEAFQELMNFLSGTFHQDIEDPDTALSEYMDEVGNEWLEHISGEIELFLNSDLSYCEKEEFITQCTDIYFPTLGIKAVEWLSEILGKLKSHIIT